MGEASSYSWAPGVRVNAALSKLDVVVNNQKRALKLRKSVHCVK